MTSDLIERLRAAKEGSRELDALIADRVGVRHRSRRTGRGVNKGREWFVDSHGGVEEWSHHPPAFTASLDAAMMLFANEGDAIVALGEAYDDATLRSEYTKFAIIKRLCIAALSAIKGDNKP